MIFQIGEEVMVPASCWTLPAPGLHGTVFVARVKNTTKDEILVEPLGGHYPPRWVSREVLIRAYR